MAKKLPDHDVASEAGQESDLEPMSLADAAREIAAVVERIRRRGTFDLSAFDRLVDPDRQGPTLEDVERLPPEGTSVHSRNWPDRESPTPRL